MSFDNTIDFKDHIVQYPNRFKQTTVAPGVVELVPTWITNSNEIIEPGTPVDSELFKKLKQNVTIYQQTFTTTEDQTVINLNRDFLVGQNRVSLSIGGVRQYAGQDYTETDSHTLTMAVPLKGGLKAEVIMFTASQAIAEDFFEKTMAAIEATQAANEAAIAANEAAETAYTVQLTPVANFAAIATTYPSAVNGSEVQTLDDGKIYRRESGLWVYRKALTPGPISNLLNKIELQKYFVSVKEFGAVGDGINDDSSALEAALNYVIANRVPLVSEPGKTYLVKRMLNFNMENAHSFSWDMMGSTIDFASGGGIVLGSQGATAFKTTTLQTELIRSASNFQVTDASGVTKGDLVKVESPVQMEGIKLTQYYTIGDIDGNTIYVDGHIAGDMTVKQMTDAGIVGTVNTLTVSFFKMTRGLIVKNGTLISKNRDAGLTLLTIQGHDKFRVENMNVIQPFRNGIYIMYCGTGIVSKCYLRDHGYVDKDQGYTSVPSSPSGLSFGYGIIGAHNYFTHYVNCHSYSGWHGFDSARGQTFVTYQDCVIHKDAYGFSTHEGAWDFRVIGCQFLGGLGVTSRAAELTIQGCYFRIGLGQSISGHSTHQSLTFINNVFDMNGKRNFNIPFSFTGSGYPLYCFSAEPVVSVIKGNVFKNLTGASPFKTRGSVIVSDNEVHAVAGSYNTSFEFSSIGPETETSLIVSNNRYINCGSQTVITVDAGSTFKKLVVSHNVLVGLIGIYGGSSLISIKAPITNAHIFNNHVSGMNFLVRMFGTVKVSYQLVRDNVVTGTSAAYLFNILKDSTSQPQQLKLLMGNVSKSGFAHPTDAGNYTIINDVNNQIIDLGP